MVVVMVVYDIRDDAVRNSVAKKLLSLGFVRIQKSAYVRRGSSGTARFIAKVLSRLINPLVDKVLILSIPDRVYEAAAFIGVSPLRRFSRDSVLLA